MGRKGNKDLFNDLLLQDLEDIDADKGIDEIDPYENVIIVPEYDKLDKDTADEAEQLVVGLLNFLFSKKIISENDYLKLKAIRHKQTISGVIKQIEFNQKMIERIFRLTDIGELNPKIFDSFSNLQKTFIDLITLKEKLLLNAEESFKKLMSDYEYYSQLKEAHEPKRLKGNPKNLEHIEIADTEDNKTFKGTRKLMDSLETEEENMFADPHED